MYKTISNLPRTLTSIAVICSMYGCAATLPSHDGSLNTVYGINNPQPQQATTLNTAETIAPVEETYEPMVQTISDSGVVDSSPIDSFETEQQTFDQSGSLLYTETVVDTKPTAPDTVSEELLDVEHTLAPGETLFSVAGDLTGSSNNWKAIADYNAISDPSEITVGQSLVIPGELLIRRVNENELSTALKLVETIKSEHSEASEPNIVVSPNGTQEIEFAALETTEEPLTIVKSTPVVTRQKPVATKAKPDGSLSKSIANFASIIKTNFKIPTTKTDVKVSNSNSAPIAVASEETIPAEPTQTALLSTEQKLPAKITQPAALKKQVPSNEKLVTPAVVADQTGEWIQVDGDFTPKAIYKGAGYTTGLLMRVSPGTTFKLTSKNGDWYEIETDNGAGYIFHRDVLTAQ